MSFIYYIYYKFIFFKCKKSHKDHGESEHMKNSCFNGAGSFHERKETVTWQVFKIRKRGRKIIKVDSKS